MDSDTKIDILCIFFARCAQPCRTALEYTPLMGSAPGFHFYPICVYIPTPPPPSTGKLRPPANSAVTIRGIRCPSESEDASEYKTPLKGISFQYKTVFSNKRPSQKSHGTCIRQQIFIPNIETAHTSNKPFHSRTSSAFRRCRQGANRRREYRIRRLLAIAPAPPPELRASVPAYLRVQDGCRWRRGSAERSRTSGRAPCLPHPVRFARVLGSSMSVS